MGVTQSSAEVLNKTINSVSLKVMSKNSTSSTGTIIQSNDLSISGNTGGSISDIEQINSSLINVSALLGSVSTGDLQSKMIAELISSISQEGAALGYTNQDSKIENIVQNSVSNHITVDNLMVIKNNVESSNTLQILANTDLDVKSIIQKNEANLIAELISKMSSDITSKMETENIIKPSVVQSVSSFLDQYGYFVIIIAVGVLAFLFFTRDISKSAMENFTKPAPMILIGAVLLVVFVKSFISSDSSDTTNDTQTPQASGFRSYFHGGCECDM